MTEARIVPRVRTETESIKTPVSKCGENWFQPVRIRAPYKGTDLAFRTLPSLGEPGQIESYDPLLLEEIAGDCKRIAEFTRVHEWSERSVLDHLRTIPTAILRVRSWGYSRRNQGEIGLRRSNVGCWV